LLVGLGILESLALAGRREVSCPFCVLGTPEILLALDVSGFVLVSICWQDLHPFWAIFLLLPFALFGPIFVLSFLLLLLWLLSLLPQLLDLSFKGEDLLLFWGWCIPSIGLFECFKLVVSEEHEGIGVDLCSFFILILFLMDVGDELSV